MFVQEVLLASSQSHLAMQESVAFNTAIWSQEAEAVYSLMSTSKSLVETPEVSQEESETAFAGEVQLGHQEDLREDDQGQAVWSSRG